MPFGQNDDLVISPRGTPGGGFGVGDELLGSVNPVPSKRVQDIGDAIIHGLQSSSMGLAIRGKLPSQQMGEDAPWYHRLSSAVGGVVGDFVPGVVGALGGGAGGTAVAGPVGGILGGGAGAFAAPMAIREALVEAYNGNHAMSWEGAWEIAKASLKGGGKGAVIGAATFGTGAVAGRVVGSMIAPGVGTTLTANAATRTIEGAAFGTELAALTTTAAALEGKLPTWQDFMDNAILLGGMKGAAATAKGLRNVWAQTGKTPEEVMADAARDPKIRADLTGTRVDVERFAERAGIMVTEGQSPKYGDRVIEMPRMSDADFVVKYGNSKADVLAHELGHGLLDKWGMTGEIKGSEYAALRAELRAVSQEFRGSVWEKAKGHAEKSGELMADGLAVWMRNPSAREKMPLFEELLGSRLQDIKRAPFEQELPEAYRNLATEERIRAALDQDNGKTVLAQFEAQAKGTPIEPTGNLVRYEYLTDAVDVQAVIRTTAEAYKDSIEAQRRGTVPTKASIIEGLDLARSAELAKAEVGRADAPHEAVARAVLTRDAATRARNMLTALNDMPAAERTPMKMLETQGAVQQLAMFYGELAGGVAEAARTLRIMREIKRNPELLGEAETILRAYEKQGKGIADLAALAQAIRDPAAFAKAANKIFEATTLEKVIEIYRANLFSGLRTHEANFLGNLGKFLVEVPENAIATTMFAVGEAAKGTPISWAQYKARMVSPIMGWMLGAKDGVIAAAEALRQRDVVNEKVEQFRLANKGAVGFYTGTVFGALQAGDMIFRIPAERAKAYVMAVDRIVKEGFNPDTAEGKAQIARYVDEPQLGLTQKAAEKVTAEIHQAGSEAVFSQRLGPRMEKVQQAIQGSLMQFVIPAFRTPANLLSWAVQHTPGLNFMSARWRADFAAGGEAQAHATARVLVGTGLAALAYGLADSGVITGSGIFDKEMKGTKRGAGWQPNSVKIGNEYYGFDRLEPVAKLFTLAADLIELGRVTKDEEDKAKIGALLVLAFGNATVSTTYLSGLSNTMRAITEPDRYGEYFMEGYAAGFVPKIIGQSVEMADPHKREVDGVLDAIQAQLPFIREKLLPKKDVWGENVKNERLFEVMPIAMSTVAAEKVRTEAMRLQVAIADAPRFVYEAGPFKDKEERVKLTEPQRNIFREISGHNAMEILRPIVNAPDWDRIPDFAKAAVYKKVLEGTRKQGEYAALPPESAERAKLREKIVTKVLQQVKEAESK